MKLVIAEKPSVAKDIAAVIGATSKKSGFNEGNGYLVTWCLGHLIELSYPEDYDSTLKKWEIETLPFIPDNWKYSVIEKSKAQYKVVKDLMHNPEVTEIICATDAGREGELIFRLVYNQTNCKKPFKRLWISSTEDTAIRAGFNNLKNGHEYDNLYYSALCRMHSDYLVGINATRLFSTIYNQMLNVGRVQTPTINLIVERQRAIENFKPVPYYVLEASCEGFVATKRVDDINKVDDIIRRCNGQSGLIKSLTKTPGKDNPSPLFDLTTLQREANSKIGLTAQETLTAAQDLYEKKLLTYPRTDSRFITADMASSTNEVLESMLGLTFINQQTLSNYDKSKCDISRLVNDKKVTDHHGCATR